MGPVAELNVDDLRILSGLRVREETRGVKGAEG